MFKNNGEFTEKEIAEVMEEYSHKTYIGSDKKIKLDESTTIYILRGRKRETEFLNSVHSSHDMTDWYSEIRSPAGTPRFYSCRECKNCEGEQYHHPAGKFIDSELKIKCERENNEE